MLAYYAAGTVVFAHHLWAGRGLLRPGPRPPRLAFAPLRDILRIGAVSSIVSATTNVTIAAATAFAGEAARRRWRATARARGSNTCWCPSSSASARRSARWSAPASAPATGPRPAGGLDRGGDRGRADGSDRACRRPVAAAVPQGFRPRSADARHRQPLPPPPRRAVLRLCRDRARPLLRLARGRPGRLAAGGGARPHGDLDRRRLPGIAPRLRARRRLPGARPRPRRAGAHQCRRGRRRGMVSRERPAVPVLVAAGGE